MKKGTMFLAFLLTAALALGGIAGCSANDGQSREEKTAAVDVEQAAFEAVVLKVEQNSLLVQPAEGTVQRATADKIAVSTGNIGEEGSLTYLAEAQEGDTVRIFYHGEIAESFPAQILGAFQIERVGQEEKQEKEPEENNQQEVFYVADAYLYRGEITSIEENTWQVSQVAGRDYGYPVMTITIDENTKSPVPWEEYAPGDYVEIFYGSAQDGAATAIGVNKLGTAQMVIYNGIIKSKEQTPERTSVLVQSMEHPQQTAVFHISSSTQVYFNWDQLQEGSKVHILYSGAMTRSLPPQATAKEISIYQEAGAQ